MTTYVKESVKELLRGNVAVVVFTKKDGTERTMKCTLLSEYIPQANTYSSNGEVHHFSPTTHKKNDEVLAVWDIEKQAWRSFRFDSIKNICL